MRVLLIHPPQATWFSPYLATPSLTAVLREAGHQVRQVDLNLRANLTLLGADWLRDQLGPAGDELATGAAASLAALRNPSHYATPATIRAAYAGLDAAYDAIGERFAPTRIADGFQMAQRPDSISDLHSAVRDHHHNPFVGLFAEVLLDELVAFDPQLVGIGLAFEGQLIPAATLARALRRRLPQAHLVLGGNLITKMRHRLVAHQWLFEGSDSAIVHEGESALLALVDALQRDPRELGGVPNLIWRDGDRVVQNQAQSEEDLAQLPTPDFDGLPLDDYLLPVRLLPLLTSRGCYWGRCAFCTHAHGYGCFRKRPADRLAADLDQLSARHGSHTFFLADEAVPPAQVKALARWADERRAPLRWFGDARFERVFAEPAWVDRLQRSGCKLLAFGLESASPRMIAAMHKGGSPERYASVLRAVHDAGIFTVVMFFSGFPGETLAEAHQTLRWVQRHGEVIDAWANGAFTLQAGSGVHVDPAAFGVANLRTDPERELSEAYDYDVRSGIDAANASRIADAIRRTRERDPRWHDALPRPVSFARLCVAGPGES